MLMFAGQTPEQLLTGSMPGTENKHYSCAQSAADLYKELFSSINSQRKRARLLFSSKVSPHGDKQTPIFPTPRYSSASPCLYIDLKVFETKGQSLSPLQSFTN